MMMLLRALLVFTSYRTPENSELNSIKLIDSRAAFVLLWNNIFSSLVHEIVFCSFEASLKMMHRWIYASTLACIATCNSRQWIILWIGFQLSVVSLQRRLVKWKLNEVFHLRNWFFVNLSFSESNFSTFSILHLRCDAMLLAFAVKRTVFMKLRFMLVAKAMLASVLIQLFFCWKSLFNCTNENCQLIKWHFITFSSTKLACFLTAAAAFLLLFSMVSLCVHASSDTVTTFQIYGLLTCQMQVWG